ncbi:GNAT family N-acetyltransferase [Sulfitobacter sp. JBTF-M27]|uniref:GNAT family N-acetyltransferase n=1 Tax=Sulfitobacter sediminilitoris TaxID=2698830 RepID=A0A6P0C9C6_9RHOB|nr:GNAT family N-acetyltransferase [Sulfitobacter sediminilitoris]NEK22772.1 GNAT family N-acetyltransferase [Sulfitobacter sediminilitoris]
MALSLRRHQANDAALREILTLIRESFAYMDGRVDPPSSMHRLTLDTLQTHAETGEIWSLGPPPAACGLFTPMSHALYIGKLSVARIARGQGLARRLIEHAALRARSHELPVLELQSRVELTENHAAFQAMGFHEVGRTAHHGYAAPTSITFRRSVV